MVEREQGRKPPCPGSYQRDVGFKQPWSTELRRILAHGATWYLEFELPVPEEPQLVLALQVVPVQVPQVHLRDSAV